MLFNSISCSLVTPPTVRLIRLKIRTPTIEELREFQKQIQTTDLGLTKAALPAVALAGWDKVVYSLTVTNKGPNPADQVRLKEGLSNGTSYQSSLPPSCALAAANAVECGLETILPPNSVNATVTALTDGNFVLPSGAPMSVVNTASVEHAGHEPNLENNSDRSEVTLVAVWAVFYPFADRDLTISDQFNKLAVLRLTGPLGVYAPAQRYGEPLANLDGDHLVEYPIEAVKSDGKDGEERLSLEGRLGTFKAIAKRRAISVLVPSQKKRSDPTSIDPKEIGEAAASECSGLCLLSVNRHRGDISTTDGRCGNGKGSICRPAPI